MSRIIARALHRVCLGRPCRVIRSGDDGLYRIQVYLAHWRGWRLYLHRFLASDGERRLHDNPFDGAALVLSGGYIEELLPSLGDVPRHRMRRWWNWVPGSKFHRVACVLPNTWTLFVHGPHRKLWGFLDPVETDDDSPGWLYFNPFDQSDSGGAHWWVGAGVAVYPPAGVE